jgi:membrane protein
MPTATPTTTGEEKSVPSRGDAMVMRPRGRLAPPLPKDAPRWKRIRRAIRRLGHGLVLHDALLAAPAMAFHFFLSLLPLLVFIGYLVGLIARRRGVDAVLSPMLDNLPATSEALVRKEVERLAGSGAATLGPAAALSFLWVASGGTHGLMNAIENVIGAPKRSWIKKRLYALGWVVATLSMVTASAFALVKWDAAVHPRAPRTAVVTTTSPASTSVTSSSGSSSRRASTSERAAPDAPRGRRQRILRSSGERALGLGVSVLFATAVLAAFYRFSVSHSKRVRRRVLPGAALAVVLWLIISWGFGIYVSSLAEYAVFYGSVAAVAVLLVWLWLTSLAILVGAELNSQLEGIRD